MTSNVSNIDIESKRDKDTTGGLTRVANEPINWCSKTQDVVALSTQESEFYTAAHAVQEGTAQNEMLDELGVATFKPILIQQDNQACIWYSEHPGSCEKTKHIRRKFYFVQQHVSE